MAYEVLHSMKTNKATGVGNMAIKLDMSKAYDRIEWCFIRVVLEKLGFNALWINMIMTCISSPTYAVLINGEPKGFIRPTRGLRQGDPLSPYIFLLCAKVFSGLLRKGKDDGAFHGVKVCRRAPSVSHLFFADDSLIFCRASTSDCDNILQLIKTFEETSGQRINWGKTNLFFSSNTNQASMESLKAFWGASATLSQDKYLGLPTLIRRNKKQSFVSLKDRVAKQIMG